MAATKVQSSITKFFAYKGNITSSNESKNSNSSIEISHDNVTNLRNVYCEMEGFDGRDSTNEIAAEEFIFPYQPYNIQLKFMRKLYETLEEGKIGIFESPTGTGKSLCLICGALTWLEDHEKKSRKDLEKAVEEAQKISLEKEKDSGLDWVTLFCEKKKHSEHLASLKEQLMKFQNVDKIIEELRNKRHSKKTEMRENEVVDDLLKELKNVKQAVDAEFGNTDNEDDDLVIKDYTSDDERTELQEDEEEDEEAEDNLKSHITKIIFCSRTHSQLSQFVKEIRKSCFGDSIRVVSLGSRQNSCINDSVQKLKSLSLMNDRCIEMQKNKKGQTTKTSSDGKVLKKKKSICGCPFYRPNAIQTLKNNVLTELKDIEELATHGRKIKACPYYASRHAVALAQLIVVPYNILLHKSMREASGIELKGNIVIIDEAHNLLDAISNIHSCCISGSQISGAYSQLTQYKEKYLSRLKAGNLLYINQIIFILQAFLQYIKKETADVRDGTKRTAATKVVTLNDFVLDTAIDNLNLFKILKYCKKSEISRKLLGFSQKYLLSVNPRTKASNTKKSSVALFLEKLSGNDDSSKTQNSNFEEPENIVASSPLMQIEEFFSSLTNMNKDGRIVINKQSRIEETSLKFYLLNPASQFQDIVSETRAVIVAGGTMQPVEEFSEQLFRMAGAEEQRIVRFACGHVIPDNHLLALTLTQGPSGVQFDFSFENRNSSSLIDELGRTIANVCNILPGGIVCFFPSYDYENEVITKWEKSTILERIASKKTVFRESRKSSQGTGTFDDYSKAIARWKNETNVTKTTGAILFSVVGGKMSEGINFSDDLGRCVIMVGMPYPNIKSPELQEKMQYLNSTLPKSAEGKIPGQAYYENLCMKAVNQSIGRAIRHKDDYATILLLDNRYSRKNIQNALPGWIRNRLQTFSKFGPAFSVISKFFQDKQRRNVQQ